MTADEFRQRWLPRLMPIERNEGIPAWAALAQFSHEGLNPDNTPSGLADQHHNWVGMKFALWQAQYGATPVDEPTTEFAFATGEQHVIDAFASFPDDDHFLSAWVHLLQTWYSDAFEYRADALLFLYSVYSGGWATDPAALYGLANRMAWLWVPPTERTVAPGAPVLLRPLPVVDRTVDPPLQYRAMGWVTQDGITYAPVKAVAQSYGGTAEPVNGPDGNLSEVELKH